MFCFVFRQLYVSLELKVDQKWISTVVNKSDVIPTKTPTDIHTTSVNNNKIIQYRITQCFINKYVAFIYYTTRKDWKTSTRGRYQTWIRK